MQGLFELLVSEPIGTVSALLALVSIALAFIFFRRSQRSKEPTWAIRTTTLMEGYSAHLQNLEVLYKNSRVENLAVSRVAFWNSGAQTIYADDIAAANRLRFVVDDPVRILDIKTLANNNPSSQFEVGLDGDGMSAPVTFDYLDHGDGAVIQVVHTGTSSKDIDLTGDIKGSKPLRKRAIRVFRYLPLPTRASFDESLRPSLRRKIRAMIYFSFGLVVVVFLILLLLLADDPPSLIEYVFAGYALLVFLVAGAAGLRTWRMHPPSGLEAYEYDFTDSE